MPNRFTGEPPEQYPQDQRAGEFQLKDSQDNMEAVELTDDQLAEAERALAEMWSHINEQDALFEEDEIAQSQPANTQFASADEFRAYLKRLEAAQTTVEQLTLPDNEHHDGRINTEDTPVLVRSEIEGAPAWLNEPFDVEQTQLQSAMDALTISQWRKLSKYAHQLINSVVNMMFGEEALDNENARAAGAAMILAETGEIGKVYMDDIFQRVATELNARTREPISYDKIQLTCRQLLLQEVDAHQ